MSKPHRYDPCAGHLTAWQQRGWRTRAEAEREPCTPMTRAELEIERLTELTTTDERVGDKP